MDDLNTYIDNLVRDKGLSDFDDDILDEIKADLHARVEDRINAVILEKLPPHEFPAFERLLDEADQDKIQAFCKKHIPDLERVIAEALVAFRATYLG